MTELTPVDRTILQMMQANSKCRYEDIAFKAGASVATVQRRIRHLRAEGVIESDTTLVDPEAVGLGMTFVILVELERERVDKLDEFRRKILSEPQIQQCYYITGEADFALVALAKDMKGYQKLIQRIFFDDTNVKRFRTSVVMDRTKVGMMVPVL